MDKEVVGILLMGGNPTISRIRSAILVIYGAHRDGAYNVANIMWIGGIGQKQRCFKSDSSNESVRIVGDNTIMGADQVYYTIGGLFLSLWSEIEHGMRL